MFYLIAFILMFIEATVAVKIFSMVITLPFLTKMAGNDFKSSILSIALLTVIYSFQNENFLYYFLIFTIIYEIFHLVLSQMTYSKENIIFFALIQMGILAFFFRKYITLNEYIFNFAGMLFSNFIFMRLTRRKSR